ncbi:DnaJ domain protein [Coleofasciculus chthonoplastes PCC 7420]|uniref:DnaJ domain protein n=1 Tax=Coleofasciculus chthonoplastes PCC 7420 TaxID=118168 RepID=B4VWB6_9CYAN|nr:J domain-containing protein [Coleofasciculus chthonoplastes]EDX73810.1 DnaJ domain protein [Coleofasciculus chthonoplastes PCC 7420]
MAQDWVKQKTRTSKELQSITYYGILGVHPSASALDIRRAYRELSKRYHPDTTDLPKETAKTKFQQLNEAYATLSSPERRILYDRTIRYSRVNVIQPPPGLNRPVVRSRVDHSSSAYLDPTDRPLSPGELFALFILGITFVGCLVLAIVIGLTRGDNAFQVSGISLSSRVTTPPLSQLQRIPRYPPSNQLFSPSNPPSIPIFVPSLNL